MANGFQQELSGVDLSAASFTTQGVRDDSRLQQAQALVGAAQTAGRAFAVGNLLGEQTDASLVEADPSLNESPATQESIDNLTKLAAARKGGMKGSEAQARAGAIVREAKSSLVGAFFRDDIDQAAKSFFGGGIGGGAGFFKDVLTPQEKAQQEFEGLVAQTSLEFGVSPDSAKEIIRHQRNQQLRISDMQEKLQNQKFTEQDYSAFATLTVEQTGQQIMGQFLRGGKMSPEQLNQLQQDLPRFASTLKQKLTQAARGPEGRALISQSALNTELAKVDKMVETLSQMSTNTSLLELSKQNKELFSNNLDIFTMQNFGDWMVFQKAGGDEGMRFLFEQMRGNQSFKAWAESNNPLLARVGSMYENGTLDPNNILSGGAMAMIGQGSDPSGRLTDEEAAGAAQLLTGKGSSKTFMNMLSEDEAAVLKHTKELMEKVPESIIALSSPEYQARFTESPDVMMKVLQSALEGAATTAMFQRMQETGQMGAIPSPISFVPVSPTGIARDSQAQGSFLPSGTAGVRAAATGTTGQMNVEGEGVTSRVRASARDMLKVARTYPQLWEGKYESAEEYITNVMQRGRDAFIDGGAEEPPKASEAPRQAGSQELTPELAVANKLASTESAGAGGDLADNQQGFVGRLQFGEARLQDAKNDGVIPEDMSLEQFRNDSAAQREVEQWHVEDIKSYIDRNNLNEFVGTTIKGVEVTPDGMIAVAHLGGKAGLKKYLQSNGQRDPQDAFGTSLTDYMSTHAGNVSTRGS